MYYSSCYILKQIYLNNAPTRKIRLSSAEIVPPKVPRKDQILKASRALSPIQVSHSGESLQRSITVTQVYYFLGVAEL